MAHLHSVYDNDTHFKIDPATRQIENTSGKVLLMQNDHNSERFTFEIPRYIDGHDMSVCNKVEVHYNNIDAKTKETNKGIYPVDDLQISPDSDDVVICSWLISQNATKFAGTLNFVLRYACLTGSVIDYQWYTDIHKGITVSESISNTEVIAVEYADVLEEWKNELFKNNTENQTEIEKLWQEVAELRADMEYEPISVVSFGHNAGTREMGETLNMLMLNWELSKEPETLTVGGMTQKGKSGGMALSNANLTKTATYSLKATDERGAEATASTTINFYNGVYYGAAAAGTIDSAFVLALATKTLTNTGKRTVTVNAPAGQHIFYALPSRLGKCTFKVGGFEGGFDLVSTMEFTNSKGYTEEYYVYRSANAGLGSTTVEVS